MSVGYYESGPTTFILAPAHYGGCDKHVSENITHTRARTLTRTHERARAHESAQTHKLSHAHTQKLKSFHEPTVKALSQTRRLVGTCEVPLSRSIK